MKSSYATLLDAVVGDGWRCGWTAAMAMPGLVDEVGEQRVEVR